MQNLRPHLRPRRSASIGGAWVARLVECLTLDFSSGCDPRVVGSSPVSGSLLSGEPLLGILCFSLLPLPPLPPPSSPLPSLKKEKKKCRHRMNWEWERFVLQEGNHWELVWFREILRAAEGEKESCEDVILRLSG